MMPPSNMLNMAARLQLEPKSRDSLLTQQKDRGTITKPQAKAQTKSKPPPAGNERTEDDPKQEKAYRARIVWRNVIVCAILHLKALYGMYLIFMSAKIQTFIWGVLICQAGEIGVTAGAHRLWGHRTYKAKWPLKLILIILNSSAFQNSVFEWVRDHRAHHKFTDTDADPHNIQRGFFFAHVGWLLCRKHPDVIRKGSRIDLKYLDDELLVQFQKRSIHPTENPCVAILSLGEGWHNYHHVFPWDYKAAELGSYWTNITTGFIDFFAKIG